MPGKPFKLIGKPPNGASMARREEYTALLQCPNCRTTGSARYEENETPSHHQGLLDRKLLNIDGEFKAASGYDPEIYCVGCGAKVS
jgi:hypothetical protein